MEKEPNGSDHVAVSCEVCGKCPPSNKTPCDHPKNGYCAVSRLQGGVDKIKFNMHEPKNPNMNKKQFKKGLQDLLKENGIELVSGIKCAVGEFAFNELKSLPYATLSPNTDELTITIDTEQYIFIK